MKTRTELIKHVYELMFGAGTLSAEESEAIEEQINPTIATLNTDNVISLASTESFDDAVFIPLAQRIAINAAAPFSMPLTVLAAKGVTKDGSEAALRRAARAKSGKRNLTIEPWWGNCRWRI
ncbi:hypothetical protein GCM10007276_12290 [Agaricicola taiwanensis]|uniref:Uncharacterized protein n=1 Tax=Agaricicola taiwanensis TaxID=591372 RepID=A0A8J2VR08_9RHOB|nr:hypothetical protein [Agaricicola taiwanensis]GGE36359.1 hypothetical protein GCM10007276_12290 [Agaricicola taiwanensis]